jgi:hypothetical protein
MTLEEFRRMHAEAAARGVSPEICCRIDDLPPQLPAWLGWLFPGLCQEAEPEIEAEP